MIPTFSVTPCSVTWRSVLHFAASLSQLDWILKPRMPTGFVSGFVWNVGQNHWKHPRIQWLIITFGFADKQLAIRQSTMVYTPGCISKALERTVLFGMSLLPALISRKTRGSSATVQEVTVEGCWRMKLNIFGVVSKLQCLSTQHQWIGLRENPDDFADFYH